MIRSPRRAASECGLRNRQNRRQDPIAAQNVSFSPLDTSAVLFASPGNLAYRTSTRLMLKWPVSVGSY